VHPVEAFSIGRSIVLPAELASHEVTRLEVRMTRLEHLPGSEGLHDIAKRNRRLVGVARHPGALRGIDRQPQVPDQYLSVGGLRNRCSFQRNSFSVSLPAGRAFKIHWRFLPSVIGYSPLR
jgi:hypothetical protein